ncbi:MAG: DUF5110 domain-containing protein [bacterium]|nr:DUF5110 domain-containing protein [bacterium]
MKETGRLFAARSVGALTDSPLSDELEARCAPAHAVADAHVETWTAAEREERATILPAPPSASGPAVTEGPRRVRFEDDGTTVRAQVAFERGTSCYGTGEVCGPLVRNGRRTWLWNTDAWAYGEESPSLYQSHPFVLALHPDGSATGVLADTARRGVIATADDGVELAFEGGAFDVHLIDAPSPQGVQRALAELIGRIALPPLWALGYHQCRWSYMNADEVRDVARRMVAHGIACTAIWLDIDYMDRHRVFTWDAARFPDPAHLVRELAASGIRTVAIVDPGVAVAADNEVCGEGLAGGHFVLDRHGAPARGRVWPGVCHFPDFTRAATRDWWAERIERFVREAELAGIWCDMNEPACMRTPTGTLPDDAQHTAGSHAEVHNLYGQQMAQATRAGLRAARPAHRPFVLTRANHIAGSRFAATWTGDNQSRWEDLRWAIPMVLNLGLSGQPFSGPDIGGFCGAPDEELFVRWFELGAWLPFCRGHGEKSSPRKEPWAHGPRALALVRAALEQRERMLPYLYTVFEEATRTGLPVARPLFFADPAAAELRAVDDAFLVGADLLVAPVVEPGLTRRRVDLPRNPGGWFAFPGGGARRKGTVEADAALGTAPVFARAGAVVVEEYGTLRTRPVWHVFLDDEGAACGTLYEDEGDGYAYESGGYARLTIAARLAGDEVEVDVTSTGNWRPEASPRRIVVHGARALPVVHDDVGVESVRFGVD